MHEELHAELEELKEIKKTLMTAVKSEIAKGVEHVDTKDLSEAMDMIKDCAETSANCWMACYYESIVKAMEESGEDDRYGYNPNRSSRTGRYMSGRRMGYIGDPHQMMQDMPYIEDYLDDPMRIRSDMMGYPQGGSNGSRGGSGRGSYGNSNMNIGYSPEGDDRYGRSYRKWKDARRYYTETKSPEGAEMMHSAANEHIADTLVTLRDMWGGADTDLKKQMKADLTKLVSEMNV